MCPRGADQSTAMKTANAEVRTSTTLSIVSRFIRLSPVLVSIHKHLGHPSLLSQLPQTWGWIDLL